MAAPTVRRRRSPRRWCCSWSLATAPPSASVARSADRRVAHGPIPIDDDTVPIACTASAEEIPLRMEHVERLRCDLEQIERTPHGLLLTFPHRDDIASELERFTVDEKGCCQFWGFEIQRDDEHPRLRWEGPPSVEDFFGQLLEHFAGDRPIAELPALLYSASRVGQGTAVRRPASGTSPSTLRRARQH